MSSKNINTFVLKRIMLKFEIESEVFNIQTDKNFLQYKIGGLLYMPAFQRNIVEKIKNDSIKNLTSIAFDLEDSIRDEKLFDAEKTLEIILHDLKSLNQKLPLIFIRVRSPQHLQAIHEKFLDFTEIITGYLLPKFDLNNAENYVAPK